MKKDRKNAGSKTLLDKSKQIHVNMPDYMPERYLRSAMSVQDRLNSG